MSFVLIEADILGAALDEALDVHNVAALRWWLQCHGIKPVPSWKKQQLISRLGPLGKRCIDPLQSLAWQFRQTTHISTGIATIDAPQQRQTGPRTGR